MRKKILILSLVMVIIDQLIKWCVECVTLDNEVIIPGLFNLTYVRNKGGAFGIFNGNIVLLALASIVTIVILIHYIHEEKTSNSWLITLYSFLVGGIIGNLIDRLFRGYVVDYLHVYLNNYHFPVFNFADSIIVIGVLLLLLETFKEKKNEPANKNN